MTDSVRFRSGPRHDAHNLAQSETLRQRLDNEFVPYKFAVVHRVLAHRVRVYISILPYKEDKDTPKYPLETQEYSTEQDIPIADIVSSTREEVDELRMREEV